MSIINKAAGRLKELYNTIDKHAYISFDVFDTLIKRDCAKPVDIFYEVEKKANQEFRMNTNFTKVRVKAELLARKKEKEEVTLDDIYNQLNIPVSTFKVEQIKKWEMQYEYELCQLNPLIKPIYEYCRKKQKKIIIISDMYLPKDIIALILNKVNVKYEALFVSSECMVTKAKGGLFTFALKQLQIEPSDILHIGDNRKSDYLVPKTMGISAFHLSKDEKMNLIIDKKKEKESSIYGNLCAFINNHSGTHFRNVLEHSTLKDFFLQIGYEAEGPLLYGYVNWLHHEFQEDQIRKVFFLARDGQLMQKAYQKLGENIKHTYMYASRKALIIPTLWMDPTISGLKECFFWGKRGTIRTILKNMGLNSNQFEKEVRLAGFDIDKQYIYEVIWSDQRFITLFEKRLKGEMILNSKNAYDLLVKYLEQIDFIGHVAIVDIGWFGNMQRALQKVVAAAKIPATIHGYYLGLRSTTTITRDANAKGYLFEPGKNEELDKIESTFNSIVEMMFTANHGSTKKYQEIDGKIVPVFSSWEYKNFQSDYESIQACQDGALAFVEDLEKAKKYFSFSDDPILCFTNLLRLGCFPSGRMAACFGNLHFEDGIVSYVAKPREHCNYIFHPKLFLSDFRDSWWRTGFLKRCFGEHFPGYNCYLFSRKIKSKLR